MKRSEKAAKILEQLEGLYPDPPVPLDHFDTFSLLVSVLLSAQTTDERVNMVTPGLFSLAKTPEAMAKVPVEEPKTKTQEVQTIFRDGEAQTNPYTPEYIIDKDNVPEVLSIANLQFNKGLPASMAEMELIE